MLSQGPQKNPTLSENGLIKNIFVSGFAGTGISKIGTCFLFPKKDYFWSINRNKSWQQEIIL